MTTEQLLILCLIRRCHGKERRVITQIAVWLNLPRVQVLRIATELYRAGYVKQLTSPVLTEAGERVANGRYVGRIGGEMKLFELVRKY